MDGECIARGVGPVDCAAMMMVRWVGGWHACGVWLPHGAAMMMMMVRWVGGMGGAGGRQAEQHGWHACMHVCVGG